MESNQSTISWRERAEDTGGWEERASQGQRSRQYFAAVVVDEDAAGAVVFEVGDLQAVGVSDLLGLEGGVDAVDLDDRLGLLRLQRHTKEQGSNSTAPQVCHRLRDIVYCDQHSVPSAPSHHWSA